MAKTGKKRGKGCRVRGRVHRDQAKWSSCVLFLVVVLLVTSLERAIHQLKKCTVSFPFLGTVVTGQKKQQDDCIWSASSITENECQGLTRAVATRLSSAVSPELITCLGQLSLAENEWHGNNDLDTHGTSSLFLLSLLSNLPRSASLSTCPQADSLSAAIGKRRFSSLTEKKVDKCWWAQQAQMSLTAPHCSQSAAILCRSE